MKFTTFLKYKHMISFDYISSNIFVKSNLPISSQRSERPANQVGGCSEAPARTTNQEACSAPQPPNRRSDQQPPPTPASHSAATTNQIPPRCSETPLPPNLPLVNILFIYF